MKKRVELALKIMAVILVLCCIGAMIWYFYQKNILKKESKEFLDQYNKYSHLKEFYQKDAKKLSEEDWQSWERDARKSLAEFVPENSVMYERIYEDIRDNFIYGLEEEKKERVKVITTKIVSVDSCRVTADTADCAILFRETSEGYDGTKGETEMIYTFRYEKENEKWMIKSFGWDFPGGI